MNLKQLEAFVCVADTGSFSATAEELFLTQPTVSAHIASLERDLNTRLLSRSTRNVQLTEKGKVLYGHARRMLEVREDIEREFAIYDEKRVNEIRVAASTIPAEYVLPEMLAAFAKEYPQYTYTLTETDSAGVIDMVSNCRADVGFAGTRADKEAHCRDIPFFRDQLVIMTPNEKRFRGRKGKATDLKAFLNEPFIVRSEGSGTRKEAEAYLASIGIDPKSLHVVASMSSQESVKKAVSSGMGITIISGTAASDYVEEGKALAFPFPGKALYRNLQIIVSKDFRLSEAAQALTKFVRQYPVQKERS